MTSLPKLEAVSSLGLLLSTEREPGPKYPQHPELCLVPRLYGCLKTRPQGMLAFKITLNCSATQLSTETTKPVCVISETVQISLARV